MASNQLLKQIITLTLLAGFSFSCSSNPNTEKTKAPDANASQTSDPHIIYGNLMINEKSDYLMIPVDVATGNQEGNFLFGSSRYSGKNGKVKPYNIIFYSKKDGKAHILLNKKALINDFQLLEYKQESGKPPKRFWFYKIIEKDTNGNKQLDSQDATVGYISDLSGKNLKQITPSDTKIMNWNVIQSIGAMFIKIIRDSDNDNRFTEKDRTAFIKINIDNPEIGKEIISNQLEKEIQLHIVK
ncbi:MAG: hypothetical protein QNJ63_06820 [Calothrix sp. MO_192.B10]|nr:hypothetical protein [Calothrix sp. MO_192.B10]